MLPLSTTGSCCGHDLSMHTEEGRRRLLNPCLACTCPAFTPEESKMVRIPDGLRRCRAYHPNGLQCEVREATTHDGDHWVVDVVTGKKVRWGNLVETFPVGDGSARLGQVGGEHYKKFKIQPWDIWEEYDLDPWRAGALKYILRAGSKGPAVEDLQKAKHYIEKCIERAEEGK